MLSAVLDPGVLIAALLTPGGTPAALYAAAVEGRFEIVASPLLLEELAQVLSRPKFPRYCDLEASAAYVAAVRRLAKLEPDPPPAGRRGPDPGDEYLLRLAAVAGLWLVTGDKPLLALAARWPAIVSPAAFLALVKRRTS